MVTSKKAKKKSMFEPGVFYNYEICKTINHIIQPCKVCYIWCVRHWVLHLSLSLFLSLSYNFNHLKQWNCKEANEMYNIHDKKGFDLNIEKWGYAAPYRRCRNSSTLPITNLLRSPFCLIVKYRDGAVRIMLT